MNSVTSFEILIWESNTILPLVQRRP